MKVILATAVLLAAAAGTVYLLRYLRRRDAARDFRVDNKAAWRKRWQELEAMLDGPEAQWSVAVIEADKLFDRIMKSMALPGQDFGERLKFLTLSRPELKFIWPAHLVRNRFVHEANYELTRREATDALKAFARGLKGLGVL
jgi:hypothetical protein